MDTPFLYTKPARGNVPFNSMDVLSVIPESILNQWKPQNYASLAEAAVNALNCCRKYSKGMLTVHLDSDLNECVAITYKGKVRVYTALSALTLWMGIDDAFEFLSSVAGIPVSLRAIEGRDLF